jgi:integrase
MAKKIDYAKVYGFTLRSDGRYMKVVQNIDKTKPPVSLYDRDPEVLYQKWQAYLTPSAPTFKLAAEMWETEKLENAAAGTRLCYTPAIRRAINEVGDKPVTEITAVDINNHIKKLAAQKFSRHTVSIQKVVYGLIFNYVIVSEHPALKGWVSINPATAVKIPRGLSKKTREAPEDDIIETIRANTDKPFGLFARMLINTGFRKAELASLTWGDVDFKEMKISCDKAVEYNANGTPLKLPKTDAGIRKVPILPDLKSVLKKPKNAVPTDLIFPGNSGIMTKDEYTKAWLEWCRAAGLTTTAERMRKPSKAELKADKNAQPRTYQKTVPAIGAHQLRHYYATMLFEAGVDELSAMQLLGHKDRATIHEIYEHLRNKQKDKSVDALSKYQKERYSGLKSDKKLTKNPR